MAREESALKRGGIIAPGMNAHSASAWVAAVFLASALFAHTVALRLVLLTAGLILAIAIAREHERPQRLPPIWLPFLLWGAWAAVSIMWSLEPERSIKEFRNEIVYAGLALWICFVAAQARTAARIIPPVLAVASICVSVTALYDFVFVPDAFPEGWHGGSGNLSSATVTLLPCALGAAWYAKKRGERTFMLLAAFIAVLLLGAAYTTLNRTVWLAFAAQLAIAAYLLWQKSRFTATRRIRLAAIAAALLVVGASVAVAVQVHSERQADGAPVVKKDPRLALWPEALEHIEERPLTGYGFGRGLLREDLREAFANPLLWHTHNLFLDVVVQVGLPGLALLVLLLAATLREGWRLALDESKAAAACGFALLAIVAGMLVRNMTDVLWVRQNALLYWGVVGVLLAWGMQSRTQAAR